MMKPFYILFIIGIYSNAYAYNSNPTSIKIDTFKNDSVIYNAEDYYLLRGTIKDENGNIIKNVHIRKIDTFDGTISDINGIYSLKVNEGDIIEISYQGKESIRFLVKNYMRLKDFDIVLFDHVEILNKINIVGSIDKDSIKRKIIDFDPFNYDDLIFQVITEKPSFPGGYDKLKNYIINNIKYPAKSQKSGETGDVTIQFTIDKKGNVVCPTICKGICAELNNEVLRVVKSMPKWNPGKNRGVPVAEIISLSVHFSLPL